MGSQRVEWGMTEAPEPVLWLWSCYQTEAAPPEFHLDPGSLFHFQRGPVYRTSGIHPDIQNKGTLPPQPWFCHPQQPRGGSTEEKIVSPCLSRWLKPLSVCSPSTINFFPSRENFFSFFFFNKHICIFSLGCTGSLLLHRLFSSWGWQGLLLVAVWRLLVTVASAVEHGLQGAQTSVSAATGVSFRSCGAQPSCPVGCEIFPHQGSILCLLHWQADSLPLSNQGSPRPNLDFRTGLLVDSPHTLAGTS